MAATDQDQEPSANRKSGPSGHADEVPEPASATHAEEDEVWSAHDPEHPDVHDQVEGLRAELAASNDRFLRARADYDNLVRRTEDERGRLAQAAAGRIIERIVAPLETLQRAAAELEAVQPEHAEGVRMAEKGLAQALAQEGLEPVPGVGSPFDHNHHEAIASEASDRPEGEVLEVIRPGYRLGGKLLRAALVKVSSGPA